MSELHSATPLSKNRTQPAKPVDRTDAGIVMQAVLQQLTPAQRQDMVLRCDDLPVVSVPAAQLGVAFESLVQWILSKKGVISPLFLHVSYSTESPADECAFYRIQLQTNLNGMDQSEADCQQMVSIGTLLTQYNCSLAFSQRKVQGSVFILSLPR